MTDRLLPYLFDNDRLKAVVNDKPFLGFSDTTMNHFMLHKLGIDTFYGQSFLADVCELENDMLPYSRQYFEEFIQTGRIKEIRPSDVWYEERTEFDESQTGIPRVKHPNSGFELLQGSPVFSGKILLLESSEEKPTPEKYENMLAVLKEYGLFDVISGVLVGKPMDETYADEYRKLLVEIIDLPELPVLANLNIGHATPRCIIPFGVNATVDANKQIITFA